MPTPRSARIRSDIRRLLRAASAHDAPRNVCLKSLLPLSSPLASLPLDAPSAPPLRSLAARALRSARLRESPGGGAVHLAEAVAALELNLARERCYHARVLDTDAALLQNAPSATHPNLPWFFSRLERHIRPVPQKSKSQSAGSAPPRRASDARYSAGGLGVSEENRGWSASEDALSVLREMVAVACAVPRRTLQEAILALASGRAQAGCFERALAAFWLQARCLTQPRSQCSASIRPTTRSVLPLK